MEKYLVISREYSYDTSLVTETVVTETVLGKITKHRIVNHIKEYLTVAKIETEGYCDNSVWDTNPQNKKLMKFKSIEDAEKFIMSKIETQFFSKKHFYHLEVVYINK